MWTPPESDGLAERLQRTLAHISASGYDPNRVDIATIQHEMPESAPAEASMVFIYRDQFGTHPVRIAPMPDLDDW